MNHGKNTMHVILRALVLLSVTTFVGLAPASDGHGHLPEGGAPAGAMPRFSAASEVFEAVGILEGNVLTVYLDRFTDNAPVRNAMLEMEIAGTAVPLKSTGDGQFTALLKEAPSPGRHAVVLTVKAGEDTNLLAAELEVHSDASSPAHTQNRRLYVIAAAAGAALVLGFIFLALRRRGRAAVASVLVVALAALPPLTEAADDHGHDHGPAAGGANPNAPQRAPDGSVFLPKPAQRQLGVRTAVVDKGPLARALELNGRVLMDPNAGGKVQPMSAGRIEAPPRGLPAPGQRVVKGEVLAYVSPAIAPADRSAQTALVAELRAARALAEKRLVRLRELADTVPRKEIEAAESEVASLGGRIAALSGGLSGREALVAPIAGVIASSSAVAGQVVDARELVFEVVDPSRMRVEALAYDAALTGEIAGATIMSGDERVALQFVGSARTLRENALPLLFRGESQALVKFAVGQPVKVTVQLKVKAEGLAVPAAALMRDASNRSVVWVKTAPERFEPRPVTTEPLDGLRVAVTSGLRGGERVVITAAGLVNQVR
jgi:cobalt-zinc-cadmium efflux system membrane fusion protein